MSTEDFDIDSLARYLHLTPTQVQKLVSRGKIPGRKVGGDWKFSSADIHHWLEEQIGVSDESELARVEDVLEAHEKRASGNVDELKLVDIIRPDLIEVPLPARTRRAVIEEICHFSMNAGVLWDDKKMFEAVLAREDLHPTALDNGVALLHPRRPLPNIVPDPFLALAISPSGIPFGGPRGTLTDVFFLIGSTSDREHLRILARVSRLITFPEFLPAIRSAESSQAIFEIIARLEADLP